MTTKKQAPKKKTPKKPTTKTTRKRKPRVPPAIADVSKSLPPKIAQIAQPELKQSTPASPDVEVPEVESVDGLTNKQRVFVEQYLRVWNATEAARRAGYSDPEQSGWENKNKLEVKAAIAARLAEHKLSADEVLARLSDMAMGSMGDFVSAANMEIEGDLIRLDEIDLAKARQAGKLHLIKSLSITDKGTKVELYDARAALELLGKHYELFSENKPEDRELVVTVRGYGEMLKKVYGNRSRSGSS